MGREAQRRGGKRDWKKRERVKCNWDLNNNNNGKNHLKRL